MDRINIIFQNSLKDIDGKFNKISQRIATGKNLENLNDPKIYSTICKLNSSIEKNNASLSNIVDATSFIQVASQPLENNAKVLEQVMRLAFESLNSSKTIEQRHAIHDQLKQLTQQYDRNINSSRFKNNILLNGTKPYTQFQIGPNKGDVIGIQLDDMRAQSVGAYIFKPNINGISQARYCKYLGCHFNGMNQNRDNGIGTSIGISTGNLIANGREIGLLNNNYISEDFLVSNVDKDGQVNYQRATFNDNDTADKIAHNLTQLRGVNCKAFNAIKLTNFHDSENDTASNIGIVFKGMNFDNNVEHGSYNFRIETDQENPAGRLAYLINTDDRLSRAGIFACANNNDDIDIYYLEGGDISIVNNSELETNASIRMTSLLDADNQGFVVVPQTSDTRGGGIDLTLEQSYEMQSNGIGIFGGFANQNLKFNVVGVDHIFNAECKNGLQEQIITINGYGGSKTETIQITQNEQADSIVSKINACEAKTLVHAYATTELTLENLSEDGTITFNLMANNNDPELIRATITTTDFTNLAKNINNVTHKTGIRAELSENKSKVKLTHDSGKDIVIKNFNHGCAYDYPFELENGLLIPPNKNIDHVSKLCYIDVRSNSLINAQQNQQGSGSVVKLIDGGVYSYTNYNGEDFFASHNSTTVGGEITFISSENFDVSSTVNGHKYHGSIVSTRANLSENADCVTLNNLDLTNSASGFEAKEIISIIKDKVINKKNDLSSKLSELDTINSRLTQEINKEQIEKDSLEKVDMTLEMQEYQKYAFQYKTILSLLHKNYMLLEYWLNLMNS